MKLSSGKSTTTLLLVVLVAALLFAVYYYVVLPKQQEADSLSRSVNSLQTEITTLQEQIDEAQLTTNLSDEFMLRKKVPATRAIDELLLNIEEIEYLTGSRINSINFNNYDSLVSESELAPTPEENEQTNEEDTTEETPVSNIAIDSLPPSLKMITVEIELESPNYARLQTFIKELERLDRTMHVDTIEYELPGEELEFGESEVIEATIQVTTFFYE